jgi:hypothetical protein
MLVADTLITIGLATISLGTIQETDGVQERTFWLRNAGREEVALTQGYTSCGCTTIHFDKTRQIVPGDSTAITLRFNPRGKGGEFHEVGTIEYGTQRKRVSLALTGTCITSEETLLRQFPIRINDTLRLSTSRFDLGIMHVGESRERSIVVLHRNGNRQERIPIRFSVDTKTPKGLQHITYPIALGEKKVMITLDVLIK